MNTAFLLLALGFGYKIYIEGVSATRKSMKKLGKIVGAFIMIVAFMGTLCTTYSHMTGGSKGSHCMMAGGKSSCCAGKGMMKGGKYCPFSGKRIPEVPEDVAREA